MIKTYTPEQGQMEEDSLLGKYVKLADHKEKIKELLGVIRDVNEWLKRTDRYGTAHQRLLEEVLEATHD